MAFYSRDVTRADEQYALPNVEVFYLTQGEIDSVPVCQFEQGWYFWACFPGCLPDADPVGPYATEQLAIDAAREE